MSLKEESLMVLERQAAAGSCVRWETVAGAPPWNLGVKRGGGDGDSQKLKFSVSLLREDIEKY